MQKLVLNPTYLRFFDLMRNSTPGPQGFSDPVFRGLYPDRVFRFYKEIVPLLNPFTSDGFEAAKRRKEASEL